MNVTLILHGGSGAGKKKCECFTNHQIPSISRKGKRGRIGFDASKDSEH